MLENLRKEIRRMEIIIENIKYHIAMEQKKLIEELFIKLNSPLERILLLNEFSAKILDLDEEVSFRTTENSIVYRINDQNFMAVYPQVNALRVEYFVPDGWENCKLVDRTEIDAIIPLVESSCDLIRKKK